MVDIPTKNPGDPYTSADFNSFYNEIKSIITEDGQTLNISKLDQLRKAISSYSRAIYVKDTSVTPNQILCSRPKSLTDVDDYFDGMTLVFIPNTQNTGATTIKLNTLDIKNLFYNGSAVPSGFLRTDKLYIAIYDLSNSRFNVFLMSSDVRLIGGVVYDNDNNVIFDPTGFALVNGDPLESFEVKEGTTSKHAVNIGQLTSVLTAIYGNQQFPLGMNIQCGSYSATALDIISFNSSFPVACIMVINGLEDTVNLNESAYVSNITASNFKHQMSVGGIYSFNYIAIGY